MCMKASQHTDCWSLLIRNNVDVSECDDVCEDWTPASSSSEPDEPSSLDCFFFLVSGSFPSASFPFPSSFFLFSSSPLLDLSSVALFLFRSDSAVSLNGEKTVIQTNEKEDPILGTFMIHWYSWETGTSIHEYRPHPSIGQGRIQWAIAS